MNTNEHEKKSGKSFLQNNWLCFVGLALFIVFAGLLIYNTWPQKHPELQELLSGLKQQTSAVKGTYIVKQETTTSKDIPVYDVLGRIITPSITTKEISSTIKTSDLPESYVISKEDMEKTLNAVAYAARIEAQEEYDKNFATLLTILTIFGIAWPVIIALLQFKFSENELAKIEKANADAEESLKQAREARGDAEKSLKQAREANEKADNSIKEVKSIQAAAYRVFSQQYYDMGRDKKNADAEASGIYNYYFVKAIEFKLQSFLLEESTVSAYFITGILTKIVKPDLGINTTSGNILTFSKSLAEEVMQNAHGTNREKEAKEILSAVEGKYKEFCGDQQDQEPEIYAPNGK